MGINVPRTRSSFGSDCPDYNPSFSPCLFIFSSSALRDSAPIGPGTFGLHGDILQWYPQLNQTLQFLS